MIVTCEQCATQFQLDDSKVPPDGIRVRCSRCKCAFFVESPQRHEDEQASDLAFDALAPDPPADPTDYESESELADSMPANPGLEDDESDWQFKEDIAPRAEPAVSDLAAAQEAVDDLLGSDFGESLGAVGEDDGGIDLGVSDLDIESPEPELAAEDVALEEPELGALAPLSEPEEDANAVTLDRGSAAGAAPEALALDMLPEAGPPADDAEAFDDPPEDLGDPEEWDYLADDEVPASPISGSAGGPSAELAAGPATAAVAPAADLATEGAVERAPWEHHDPADLALDSDVEAAASSVWIARARNGIGWGLVGLLCAYAVAVGLGAKLWPSQAAESGAPIAGLEVESIKGRWVENAVAGPIYVVSGELQAQSSAPLPAGSLLRIRLLDTAGAPIAVESAAVGPPLPSHRVREWKLRDLRDVQEAGALRMARRAFVPGQPRLFVAVLGDLPHAAAAYQFQVVAAASPAASAAEHAYPVEPFAAEGMPIE